MNLQDIFDHLAHGELSNLFVGESGDILSDQRVKITSSIRLGLSDIYTRLLVKEGSEQVTITRGTSNYTLTASDLINVERIENSEEDGIILNDVDNDHSFLMLRDNVLNIHDSYFEDYGVTSETITVYYRAAHPELDLTQVQTNPNLVDIELPRKYLKALLLFVASRVHTPVGLSSDFHQGNDYLAKYEGEIARLEMKGVAVDRVSDANTFEAKGFV